MKSSWEEDKTLLALPFDQYSRQAWAAVMVKALRKGTRLKILDVGGYKGKTADFFPSDNVTVCDLFDVSEKNYVKGDGRTLPFEDDSFDFVVTFDTYEHVPRNGRDAFLQEIYRVSKSGVILAAPFENDKGGVGSAERLLNEYHKMLYKKDHPWLIEHIEYQIPLTSEITKKLKSLKMGYSYLSSNHLDLWVTMQNIYFSIEIDQDLRGRVDDLNRKINSEFKSIDVATDTTSYRKIFFISKLDENVKKINSEIIKDKKHTEIDHKAETIAAALNVYGRKYQDATKFSLYLESEVDRLELQLKHDNKTLKDEIESQKSLVATLENSSFRRVKRNIINFFVK